MSKKKKENNWMDLSLGGKGDKVAWTKVNNVDITNEKEEGE